MSVFHHYYAEIDDLNEEEDEPKKQEGDEDEHTKRRCTNVKSLDELGAKYKILGKCAQPAFEIVVVTESEEKST